MDWKLSTRLKSSQKPIIRRFAGAWICFVKLGITDRQAADKARDWCNRMNSK